MSAITTAHDTENIPEPPAIEVFVNQYWQCVYGCMDRNGWTNRVIKKGGKIVRLARLGLNSY
jgi:hypothetical protein